MKIVFFSPGKNPQPWLDCLRAHLPAAEVWAWTAADVERQADYAVLWTPPRALFETQHQLKAIFNIGAGADRITLLPDLSRLIKGAAIVRLNDAGMAVQMAEYVCHAVIRHTRDFATYDAQQQVGEWKTLGEINRAAWPVGVMGIGAIGQRVAQSIAAFDYPVFGWSRTPKAIPGIATFAGQAGLDEFLARVRVLVCALPLTPATEGILNRRTLAKLKAPGYLINVARGAHLVDADLIAMLDSGVLAGATLDVFHEEPLAATHPFWHHPKITVTPHISAITLREESAAQIAQKIAALERGEVIEGIVSLELGY
ncbi:MAG: glyoxylate/hydroxypyruvate reductase A [Betaproteobacteria bacterium]